MKDYQEHYFQNNSSLLIFAPEKSTVMLNREESQEDDIALSFEEIYRKYLKKVYFYAYNYLNDHDLSKNVAQDVFLSFYEARGRVVKKDSVLPYLLISTRNKCLNILKKKSRAINYANAVYQDKVNYLNYISLENEASKRIITNEVESLLCKAVEKMTPKVRATFMLSRMKGMTNAEAAEVLGVSVRTIEERIKLAMLSLRKTFKEYL